MHTQLEILDGGCGLKPVGFDVVVDFLEDTHRVKLDRPVMFPDVIGGHCLIPNAELLLKSYDSKFLRLMHVKRNYNYAVKHYSPAKFVHTTLKVYEDVLF